jgi:hypothetical protein
MLLQVVIPHGLSGSDFETYFVAAVSFLVLCFAIWRSFRRGSRN